MSVPFNKGSLGVKQSSCTETLTFSLENHFAEQEYLATKDGWECNTQFKEYGHLSTTLISLYSYSHHNSFI